MAAHFQSLSDLEPIQKLILTTAKALHETAETPRQRAAPRPLGVILGAVAGLCVSAGMLASRGAIPRDMDSLLEASSDFGASFNGGIEFGMAVAGLPVIVGSVIGYWLLAYFDKRRLIEAETLLLQEAWRLHEALVKELQDRREKEQPGGDDAFLFSLATKLNTASFNLKADLKRKGY